MMSPFELIDYDGSAGFLVDSNVWIDCIDARSARGTCLCRLLMVVLGARCNSLSNRLPSPATHMPGLAT